MLLTVLKVREDQEKRRIEEEQLPAQQPGPQSSTEVSQPQQIQQPASYIPPQPTQHSTQIPTQPASQQSLQSSNYSAPQSTQHTGMGQGVPYAPHSIGQVPVLVQGQSVATIKPETEEPETDQHQQLQHSGGDRLPGSSILPDAQPPNQHLQTQSDQTQQQQMSVVSLV